MAEGKNVFGEPLEACCSALKTGFYRTGACETGPEDRGAHVVCAEVTEGFLAFCRSNGNDLSTPIATFNFPGLKPGDRWCICAGWWKRAFDAGVAPPVLLTATHENALHHLSFDDLKTRALDVA